MGSRAEINPWQRDKQWQRRIHSEAFWGEFSSSSPRQETWGAGLIPIKFGSTFATGFNNGQTSAGTTAETGPNTPQLGILSPKVPGSRPGTGMITPRGGTLQRSSRTAAELILDSGPGGSSKGERHSSLQKKLEEEREQRLHLEDQASKLQEEINSRRGTAAGSSVARPPPSASGGSSLKGTVLGAAQAALSTR
eukprot:gb/GFBE01031095.1/.p1 GENE.gb/GFBE01031095.1/~~gb/GFBE01031095.1/.p1  ORF type:complete len:194 (+),score=25.37 gb/GFBE01031095.1/:1-582(+)